MRLVRLEARTRHRISGPFRPPSPCTTNVKRHAIHFSAVEVVDCALCVIGMCILNLSSPFSLLPEWEDVSMQQRAIMAKDLVQMRDRNIGRDVEDADRRFARRHRQSPRRRE